MSEVKGWGFKILDYCPPFKGDLKLIKALEEQPGYVAVTPDVPNTGIICRTKVSAKMCKNFVTEYYPNLETTKVMDCYFDSIWLPKNYEPPKDTHEDISREQLERQIYANCEAQIANLEKISNAKDGIIAIMKKKEKALCESYEKRIRELTKELNAAEAQMRRMEQAMHGKEKG